MNQVLARIGEYNEVIVDDGDEEEEENGGNGPNDSGVDDGESRQQLGKKTTKKKCLASCQNQINEISVTTSRQVKTDRHSAIKHGCKCFKNTNPRNCLCSVVAMF